MATYNLIPNAEGQIRQINKGEKLGELYSSWNIDLQSEPGKVRVAQRLKTLTTSADDANLGLPVRFLFHRGVWWAYAGDRMYKNDGTATGAFAADAISGTPTNQLNSLYGDGVLFNGAMVVSNQSGLYRLPSGGNWTTNNWWTHSSNLNQATLDTAYPHPLAVSSTALLCIGDGNKLHTVTTGSTVTNPRLTLADDVYITWIRPASTRVWIGTAHKAGGEGLVYEWDGGNTLTNRAYRVGATGTYTGLIVDDNLIIVTSDGSVKEYDGGGFKTIAQFPVKDKGQIFKFASDFTASNFPYQGFIHPRGSTLVDGIPTFVVANELVDTTYDNPDAMPAGVWQLSPENGLYHRHSPQIGATGSTGFGSFSHYMSTMTGDKGSGVGAIQETKQVGSKFFVGFRTHTDNASTTLSNLCVVDVPTSTLAKRGRIITPFIHGDLNNVFQSISMIFDTNGTVGGTRLTDSIIIKYRLKRRYGLPFIGSVTWVSTTQFTSTDSRFAKAAVGDEVWVTLGNGHGCIEQISAISENAGTYTVTLLSAVTGVSNGNTGKVKVDNWKPLTTVSDLAGLQNYIKRTIPETGSSPKCQFSVELRSGGENTPEIDEFLVELTKQQ